VCGYTLRKAKRARRERDEALQTNTPPLLLDTKADADRGIRAARLQAIKSDILDNLGETSITVARVAARHSYDAQVPTC
jgi:hypothetical protein